MGNIIAEPFLNYVINQIKSRQKAHGSGYDTNPRTPEYLTYLNSKTSWVKLASGVDITEDRLRKEGIRSNFSGIKLAKDRILYGGTARLSSNDQTLIQRGTGPNKNITDYYTGTYNVNQKGLNKDLEFGLVPMPGIESVDIKSKNRGSLEEATIKIKAYNKEQFDFINLLYLRLGYTVFLEWGNSIYLDNKDKLKTMGYTIMEDSRAGFFTNVWKDKQYSDFLRRIEGYRKGKDGNYDGMLAKVKNFSWSFSQDGSYDIELSLISLGDVIESLKINITPPIKLLESLKKINAANTLNNDVEGDDDTEDSSSALFDNYLSAYLYLWQQSYNAHDKDGTLGNKTITITTGGNKTFIGYFIKPLEKYEHTISALFEGFDTLGEAETKVKELNQLYKKEVLNNNVNISISQDGIGNIFDTDYEVHVEGTVTIDPTIASTNSNYKDVAFLPYIDSENEIQDTGFYMRFGHLLEFIQEKLIPKIEGSKDVPQIKIDYNQWENKMYHFPLQFSHDPRVCIAKSKFFSSNNVETKFFPQLPTWNKKGVGYSYTMNLYLNFNMIQQAIDNGSNEDGDLSVFTLLTDICTELNRALGGVNNLQPVINKDTNTIQIIDSSYSSPKPPGDYDLNVFGYNNNKTKTTNDSVSSNFVRSFDLKTEITKEYASMITVGATAGGYVKGTENTMFSKWNSGITDRFKPNLTPGDPASITPSGSQNEAVTNYLENFVKEQIGVLGYKYKDIGWVFTDEQPMLDDELIDKNVSIVTEFYKYCQTDIQKRSGGLYASPTKGFIPFNLSLTFDGISGIKIYNSVNVNTTFLPQNYPESLKFVIKGVNHKLSNNDWETQIETVVIPETFDTNGKPIMGYKTIFEEVVQILKDGLSKLKFPSSGNISGAGGGGSGAGAGGAGGGGSSRSSKTVINQLKTWGTGHNNVIPHEASKYNPSWTHSQYNIEISNRVKSLRSNPSFRGTWGENFDYHNFARKLLKNLNLPVTKPNVFFIFCWFKGEGVGSKYTNNPMATTKSGFGGVKKNSHGVRAYPDFTKGLKATQATLKLSYYNLIREAFSKKLNTPIEIWEYK